MSTPSPLPRPLDYFIQDLCRLLLVFEKDNPQKVAAIRIYDLPDGSGLNIHLEFASGERPKPENIVSLACCITIEAPHGTAAPAEIQPKPEPNA